jgi:hypothetical protein
MTALNVTRVVNGKKVIPKTPRKPQKSKAYFVRLIVSQLNDALVRDARILTKLNQRKKFDEALQDRINLFMGEVIAVLDSFPTRGERIPATFTKRVRSLEKLQENFVEDCQKQISGNDIHSRRTVFVVRWLGEEVSHFATKVNIASSSITVLFDSSSGEMLPPSLKNIPNRHRDPQKEQIFIDANIDYHNGKGKKEFAPYKFVLPYMEKAGLKFPERTYRLFKVDFRKNNFGKLVRN